MRSIPQTRQWRRRQPVAERHDVCAVIKDHTEGKAIPARLGQCPKAGEVAGHLHPAAKVVAYSRGVRRPCFITDGRRIVLPAFGAFTGGLNVRDPAIAGLFASPPMAAALGRDRVHALSWGSLV